MPESYLRVNHVEPDSRVNGPGVRCVIWTQGCSLGCPGCFNPQTHPIQGGYEVLAAQLVDTIIGYTHSIDGLTISGGEPLQQARPLLAFLRLFRQKTSLPVILFSGFTWEEIQAMPIARELPKLVDVLIAGRYFAALNVGRHLTGSANKTFHFFTGHYSRSDFNDLPEAEVIIQPDGEIISSGISPFYLNHLHD